MAKAKIGDKVRIVNAAKISDHIYGNGAKGVVIGVDEGTVSVVFTKGWMADHEQFTDGFNVYHEEYEVISNESETQTKKEKEMGNQIKMKRGVYAVVDSVSGEVLAVDTVREDARDSLQRAKNNGVNAKLVKMQPQKWVR